MQSLELGGCRGKHRSVLLVCRRRDGLQRLVVVKQRSGLQGLVVVGGQRGCLQRLVVGSCFGLHRPALLVVGHGSRYLLGTAPLGRCPRLCDAVLGRDRPGLCGGGLRPRSSCRMLGMVRPGEHSVRQVEQWTPWAA